MMEKLKDKGVVPIVSLSIAVLIRLIENLFIESYHRKRYQNTFTEIFARIHADNLRKTSEMMRTHSVFFSCLGKHTGVRKQFRATTGKTVLHSAAVALYTHAIRVESTRYTAQAINSLQTSGVVKGRRTCPFHEPIISSHTRRQRAAPMPEIKEPVDGRSKDIVRGREAELSPVIPLIRLRRRSTHRSRDLIRICGLLG